MTGDTRLWMYRNGEARLFEHPDHVPASAGWSRFPEAACSGEAFEPPPAAREMPRPQPELTSREKLDLMPRRRLMQIAAGCGIRFDLGWTKAQLKRAIIEVLNDNCP